MSKDSKSGKKPHYYGKVDGVHVFHATDDSHSALVGMHLQDASDDEFKNTLRKAKDAGVHAIVLHGAPPESYRHKFHPELGGHKPGKLGKSLVEPVTLAKTLLQPDKATMSDIKAHAASLEAAPKSLLKWGAEKLSSLPKDAIEQTELDGKIIKVRKHDTDLYSGWIESKDGRILHQFEKITMPELMIQLQSKLELYGREESVVNEDSMDGVQSKLTQLRDRIKSYLAEAGLEPEHDDKEEDQKEPAPVVEGPKPEAKVDVPTKDLIAGMLNPEKDCPACENPVDKCSCFTGMPTPRMEIDLKGGKVSIFFKAELWGEESQEAFVEDFKRRAGRLLRKSFS